LQEVTVHKNFSFGAFALLSMFFMSSAHSCERGGESPSAVNAKVSKNPPAVEDVLSCTIDTDCTVVKDDCCGCNAGGKQRAIAVSGSEAWLDKLASSCQDIFCAAVISRDPSCGKKAICAKGQCELR
jgi:hypothetical protein